MRTPTRLLPCCCLLVAALLLSASAHGQAIALYGTFSPTHVANVVNGGAPATSPNSGASTTSYWSPGFGGGATFGVVPIGPLRLGLDIRGSGSTSASASTLVLSGIKLAVRLPLIKLRPYVQASGGYLGTKVPIVNSSLHTSLTAHYAAYEVLGGVDYPLAPFIDLRLIELGGGEGLYLTGSPGTSGNVSLFTLHTGVVVHF